MGQRLPARTGAICEPKHNPGLEAPDRGVRSRKSEGDHTGRQPGPPGNGMWADRETLHSFDPRFFVNFSLSDLKAELQNGL
jgi:hypothetical protein